MAEGLLRMTKRQAQSKSIKVQAESKKAESKKTESKKAETKTKKTETKSKKTEPNKTETKKAQTKTNKSNSGQTKSGQSKSGQSKAGKSDLSRSEISQSKLSKSGLSGAAVPKAGRAQAREIMDALLSLYPDSACELVFASDFQLLIAVILSAQCTDQQVNRVTEKLYARFPDAKALAEADLEEIKAIIKPTGYFNAKANNIQNCARMLITKYGGKVPQSVEELTILPGVGRKTANVVLGVLHNIPGWSVDTHVQRLSKRFGFTREEDPLKIENDLQKLFPGEDWSKLSITIIWHGRRLCYARKPACGECPLQSFCPSSEV
ncbi:MAG: Ultraviolet N-glycosylase/AP lyase [bacterium ADurb.Bin425]|nr:MAG: Ultraviolet N-glycosylase/AP lyase [bacterium ADurb.Bin425]